MDDFTKLLRKKLTYRSLNRGCRETDILLGKFATHEIENMHSSELQVYEKFLDEYDGDIYKWLTGQLEMPDEYKDNIGAKLLNFKYS